MLRGALDGVRNRLADWIRVPGDDPVEPPVWEFLVEEDLGPVSIQSGRFLGQEPVSPCCEPWLTDLVGSAPTAASPADPGASVEALADLRDWWLSTAQADMAMVAPKAVEYGSVELEEMGAALARMMGRSDLSRARRVELACWFYAMGKMQRWTAAVTRGEFVSDDTLTDLGVYTLMVRRAREAGTWPGGPDRD